jgi:hypothetical protein
MTKTNKLEISNYSSHLFWDVDKSKLDLNNRKAFLVNRVLDYGVMSDWKQLVRDLGIEEIGQIALGIKHMDPKSLSFIALVLNKDIKCFRSYITIQSNKVHWVY